MWSVVLRGVLIAAAIVVVASSSAWAQDADVEAEMLFREGKALLKADKIAEACAKFEASELRAHNINTLVNLADCRERNGQLASAWGLFIKATSEARLLAQEALEKSVRARAAKLESKLSYLTVVVSDSGRVAGLTVSRDGETIEPALWNSAVPVDGGTYQITVGAPGHESWSSTVAVAAAEGRVVVEIPLLAQTSAAEEEAVVPPVVEPPAPAPRRESSSGGGRRLLAYGLGGVGLLALGAGSYAGLRARSTWTEVEALCPDRRCASQGDFDRADGLVDDARGAANLSTILIGAGLAVTTVAVIVWLTAPDGDERPDARAWRITPTLDEAASGVAVMGSF